MASFATIEKVEIGGCGEFAQTQLAMIKNAEHRKVIRLDPSVKTLTFTTLT